jgi:hypothetical protein
LQAASHARRNDLIGLPSRWNNLPGTLLELARHRELPLKDREKFRDQREHAPLPILRLAGLQP